MRPAPTPRAFHRVVQQFTQLPQVPGRLLLQLRKRRAAAETAAARRARTRRPSWLIRFTLTSPFFTSVAIAGKQPVQGVGLVGAEVGQQVVVHAHAAAQPLVRPALAAQPLQFPRAAHAPQRGVQPQRHQQPRVGGVTAGDALCA